MEKHGNMGKNETKKPALDTAEILESLGGLQEEVVRALLNNTELEAYIESYNGVEVEVKSNSNTYRICRDGTMYSPK